jgi:cullin 3
VQDRVWTRDAGVPSIVDKGRELFLKNIIRPPIKDHVASVVLNLLRIERDGYVIDRSAVTGCVDVLLQLSDGAEHVSVYKRDLEPSILRETTAFYDAEGVRLLQTCDASEYLRRVRRLTPPSCTFCNQVMRTLGRNTVSGGRIACTPMLVPPNGKTT